MNKTIIALLTATALNSVVFAAPQSFDFKDPKGVNNAVFKLDAPLEAINGSANGVSGAVTFDPADPAATRGKIIIASSSLNLPNALMKEHLHGAQWLDVAKQPEISFEARELKNVKTSGNSFSADAAGTLTIKGVAREMTVPVKLTYLEGKLGQRVPNLKGDLLVIRSSFTINRGDFGINPGAPKDKVSDDIEITLSIAGGSPR